jgi:cell division protein FtsB
MKKIAIALILFQLIGCAKQPAIVTNQGGINRIKCEDGINRLKAEAEKNNSESILLNVALVVVTGIFSIFGMILIYEIKKVEEMKDAVKKLKCEYPQQQADLKDLKRGQRCLRYEVKKLKVRAAEEDLEAC